MHASRLLSHMCSKQRQTLSGLVSSQLFPKADNTDRRLTAVEVCRGVKHDHPSTYVLVVCYSVTLERTKFDQFLHAL